MTQASPQSSPHSSPHSSDTSPETSPETSTSSHDTSSLALVIIGVIAISFAAPLFKLSAPTHPLIAAATRLSVAMSLWLLITLITQITKRRALRGHMNRAGVGELQRLDRSFDRAQLRTAALCGVCYAVHFGAWVWSLGLTSVITSATLVTTTPLMLGVIGLISGRDRPSPQLMMGGAIAAIGVVGFALEATWSAHDTLLGDSLALLGALAMVPYLLLTRRLGARLELAPFSLVATGVGALLLWGSAWVALPASAISLPTGDPLLALIGAAVIPQLVGHSALTLSLRRLTPTEVGVATLLEPLGAASLAWWWMGESPSVITGAASLVTLLGVSVALAQRSTSGHPAQ